VVPHEVAAARWRWRWWRRYYAIQDPEPPAAAVHAGGGMRSGCCCSELPGARRHCRGEPGRGADAHADGERGGDAGGDVAAGVAEELGVRGVQLLLQAVDLALEHGDGADAAVDGVLDARLGLVGERAHGVLPLVRQQLVEQLGHVAGAEHLVHVGELLRLLRREVGREHAPRQALAPQELARRARRPGTGRRRP